MENEPLTQGAARVLAAAGALFYERGIHAVGVDLIAETAGVTKKTLYDRFGSKDHLVAVYLRERERRWREFLAERLAGRSPAESLVAIFEVARQWEQAYAPRGCAFVNARAELPDPEHPGVRVIDGSKRHMVALFVRLADEAGAGQPAELGHALYLWYEGALVASGLNVVPDAWARAKVSARWMVASRIASGQS